MARTVFLFSIVGTALRGRPQVPAIVGRRAPSFEDPYVHRHVLAADFRGLAGVLHSGAASEARNRDQEL